MLTLDLRSIWSFPLHCDQKQVTRNISTAIWKKVKPNLTTRTRIQYQQIHDFDVKKQ